MSRGTKLLPFLQVGTPLAIQDQYGNTPKRWSKTGKVLESFSHDSGVKLDGAGRTTKRNRQFLKQISPYVTDVDNPVTPWAPVNSAPTVDHINPVDAPVLEFPDIMPSGFAPVATAPLPPLAPPCRRHRLLRPLVLQRTKYKAVATLKPPTPMYRHLPAVHPIQYTMLLYSHGTIFPSLPMPSSSPHFPLP